MVALSRRQRVLATTVLAAGAFAAIASSPIEWSVHETVQLPTLVLDDATPSVGFAIRGELRGPIETAWGSLNVPLELSLPAAEVPTSASLHIELVDSRTGEPVDAQDIVVPSGEPTSASLWAEPWLDCQTPCEARYELWIDRTDTGGDVPVIAVQILGSVGISAGEYGKEDAPPAGTELTVTVAPIEVQP